MLKDNHPSTDFNPIIHLLSRFIQLRIWIINQLLMTNDQKKRVNLIETLISIAQDLVKLSNFHDFTIILSALKSHPIQNLMSTWTLVSNDKKASLSELQHVFNESKKQISSAKISQTNSSKSTSSKLPFFCTFYANLMILEERRKCKVQKSNLDEVQFATEPYLNLYTFLQEFKNNSKKAVKFQRNHELFQLFSSISLEGISKSYLHHLSNFLEYHDSQVEFIAVTSQDLDEDVMEDEMYISTKKLLIQLLDEESDNLNKMMIVSESTTRFDRDIEQLKSGIENKQVVDDNRRKIWVSWIKKIQSSFPLSSMITKWNANCFVGTSMPFIDIFLLSPALFYSILSALVSFPSSQALDTFKSMLSLTIRSEIKIAALLSFIEFVQSLSFPLVIILKFGIFKNTS